MRRLLLVRHAATASTRSVAFPHDDDVLDERSLASAEAFRPALPVRCEAISSPAARCRQTAVAAGLDAETDPALAECDFGTWARRTLESIAAEDPDGVSRWMRDPGAAPHGGENLTSFAKRVGRWLDVQARRDGSTIAITHGGVIKAILVHALGAPLEAFWRIDVSPLTITEIHAHDERWTIMRTNCAPGGVPS